MTFSPENPFGPISNDNQTELFPDTEPTVEVTTHTNTETSSKDPETISPTETFKALVGASQDPHTYGLDTDEKIMEFVKKTEGSNPFLALAALTRELEDKSTRADLR